ncbi:MAG: NIPSNAP family protein [Methylobacteriaceae bacterium]|nr:NIPSNAP family protein [Methylobacteriaceae bacterium]MBV9218754.1 NIPSNAP family protein [Methylobacteriaceae bacterium]
MITCCIRYTLDSHKLAEFEEYARRWPPIIKHCGGDLVGYFLPKEGASNWALALINFESLESYATYRKRLLEDEGARANVAYAAETKCILVEDRTFLRPA